MLRRPTNLVAFMGHGRSVGLIAVRANSTAAATEEKPQEWDKAKPFKSIPGPKPLPIIGNAWRFLPGIGEFSNLDLGKMSENFYCKYGKISRFGGIPGRKDLILLFDPNDFETVLRNEGTWPIRPGIDSIKYYRQVTRKDFFKDAGGLGVSQGEEWGKFRTKVNQPMMQPKVARKYVEPMNKVAMDFIQRMSMLRGENHEMPNDFLNELYKWALESICLITLDTRLGCLQQTLAPDSEPQQMINSVKVLFDSVYELDFSVPLWRVISTPLWRRFVSSADFVRDTGMKYVNLALERLTFVPPDSDKEMSLLERILARDPDPKVACVMAIDMMMAGIETTSNAVAFLLYYLAVNPDKQKTLQEEIDRVLPPSNETGFTPEHLNDLKYLKACSKEAMRMKPVPEGNLRTTIKDLVLQGYQIPEGTDLLMGHHTISLVEDYYPKADKFIPERWLKNDPEGTQKAHPFVTMPFGFGVRMCVGRRFAELQMDILVAKILQKFNVEWHHAPLVTECKLFNSCKSPLKFKMVDRL